MIRITGYLNSLSSGWTAEYNFLQNSSCYRQRAGWRGLEFASALQLSPPRRSSQSDELWSPIKPRLALGQKTIGPFSLVASSGPVVFSSYRLL